jgi:hypothetical protein
MVSNSHSTCQDHCARKDHVKVPRLVSTFIKWKKGTREKKEIDEETEIEKCRQVQRQRATCMHTTPKDHTSLDREK